MYKIIPIKEEQILCSIYWDAAVCIPQPAEVMRRVRAYMETNSVIAIEMFQVSRDKLLAPARNIPDVQVRDGSLRCSRL